jgi:4-carboxymuconolactone decarboxylase
MELLRNHSVSDATYERAVARFGEQGVVEAVSLMGYYAMIAMLANVSRAQLPAGAKPALIPIP